MMHEAAALARSPENDRRILTSRGADVLFDGDLAAQYPAIRHVGILWVMPVLCLQMAWEAIEHEYHGRASAQDLGGGERTGARKRRRPADGETDQRAGPVSYTHLDVYKRQF